MNKKLYIANIIFNSLIVACTIAAIIMMFTSNGGTLQSSSWTSLKYFTVDSNILMGVTSAISLFFLIFKRHNPYPTWVAVIKMIGTTGVSLTFIVVFTYLASIISLAILLENANLFMHLIIPVLAIISFIFVEPKVKLKFKYNFFPILPVVIYSLGYLINVASKNEYGNFKGADWYGFGQYGLGIGFIFLFGCIAIAFGVSVGLYFLHQKTKIKALHE